MAANQKKGRSDRNGKGQFKPGHPGGPGRPKGRENESTAHVRQLRRRILDSFDELDAGGQPVGMVALRELRTDNPAAYLKLIASLLPAADSFVGDSSSDTAPLATTPEQILTAIEKRKDEPRDPKRGLRITDRGSLRSTGGDPGPIAG